MFIKVNIVEQTLMSVLIIPAKIRLRVTTISVTTSVHVYLAIQVSGRVPSQNGPRHNVTYLANIAIWSLHFTYPLSYNFIFLYNGHLSPKP